MSIPIGSRVVTGVWIGYDFRPTGRGTVIGYNSGIYTIQRDYYWDGKQHIETESYNYVFPLRQYICPSCGRTVETSKGSSDIKTCDKCKHQTVSTVLFEE